MKRSFMLALAFWLMVGCAPQPRPEKSSPGASSGAETWNITVLLDLSDRIRANRERDIELVRTISTCFRDHFAGKNLFAIRDRLRVLFYPEPRDQRINKIAENLKVQLNPADKAQIRNVWESIEHDYSEQLNHLYDLAEAEGKATRYPGSDIWRFFKERAAEYCIERSDTNCRNILVILTDGYVFHQDSQTRVGNRTSFLTGPFLDGEGLRNNTQWREKFDTGNYGFIANPSELGANSRCWCSK
jgi:hypothetical protein